VRRRGDPVVTLCLGLLALAMLTPLLWALLGSLKPSNLEVFERPFALPSSVTWENYARAIDEGQMASYLANSILVTTITAGLVVLLGALAGYPLSKRRLPGQGIFTAVFVVGMVLPVESYLLPLGRLLNLLGLHDSLWALILPYTAQNLPLAILLFSAYFKTLPPELEEAALLEGASRLRFVLQILLPVSRPVVATVAVLTALTAWNEFLLALLFVFDPARKTLTVGMVAFQQSHSTDFPALLAGLSLISLGSLLIYIVFKSMAKKSPPVPVDVGTLSRWLLQDPKAHFPKLQSAATKASADAFERRAELYRLGLKWAWDENPDPFFTLTKPWFKSTNARLRRLAAGALPVSHEGYTEKCAKQLKKLITDKDRATRLLAIDLLAESAADNLDLIKRWAKDGDAKVRELVGRHLRHVKGERIKDALPLLADLAMDDVPEVHWAATSTLLELYGREPRPVLEVVREMARSEKEPVRLAAAAMFFEHVFADNFDTLLPTIRSWLRAGDPHLRWTLVRSLRFTKISPRSLQLLRALYEDKDPEIRRRAVQVLLRNYDPIADHRRQLTDLLKRAEHDTSKKIRDLVEEGRLIHGEDYLDPEPALSPEEEEHLAKG
jgi:raffinose/stachyose/melibiose transport system permease protein